MAIKSHITINVYGEVEGNPPFQTSAGVTSFSREKIFPKPGAVSFPTDQVSYHPLPNGYLVNNLNGNFYVYSVIEVQPSGLNVHGTKYISDQSVATLATNSDNG